MVEIVEIVEIVREIPPIFETKILQKFGMDGYYARFW